MEKVLFVCRTGAVAEQCRRVNEDVPWADFESWQRSFTGRRWNEIVVVVRDQDLESEFEKAAYNLWRTEHLPTLITQGGHIEFLGQ